MSDHGSFSASTVEAKERKQKEGKSRKELKVPLLKLFSFADFYDCVLMAVGSIGACVHGASVPVFFIFFGKMINVIGFAYLFPKEASHQVAKYSLDFVYLSIVILFSSWTEVACWMHTGERQAAKMRMAYLRSMLNQDISLFDTDASTGEVISAITSDIIVVQDALSEKFWSLQQHPEEEEQRLSDGNRLATIARDLGGSQRGGFGGELWRAHGGAVKGKHVMAAIPQ